ncbi:MAG: PEP-CTERM sorting domain-containing protein [Hyphomicrobiales bacterium]|nr:PEP-CTERM sorting domain-containing protein [Hyphomicrobiales bacterium]
MKNSKQPKSPRKARHWTRSFTGGATLAFLASGTALAAGTSASRLMVMLLSLLAFLASAGTTLYLASSNGQDEGWAKTLSNDVAVSDEVLVVADVVADEQVVEPEAESAQATDEEESDTSDTAATDQEPPAKTDFASLSSGSSGDVLLSSGGGDVGGLGFGGFGGFGGVGDLGGGGYGGGTGVIGGGGRGGPSFGGGGGFPSGGFGPFASVTPTSGGGGGNFIPSTGTGSTGGGTPGGGSDGDNPANGGNDGGSPNNTTTGDDSTGDNTSGNDSSGDETGNGDDSSDGGEPTNNGTLTPDEFYALLAEYWSNITFGGSASDIEGYEEWIASGGTSGAGGSASSGSESSNADTGGSDQGGGDEGDTASADGDSGSGDEGGTQTAADDTGAAGGDTGSQSGNGDSGSGDSGSGDSGSGGDTQTAANDSGSSDSSGGDGGSQSGSGDSGSGDTGSGDSGSGGDTQTAANDSGSSGSSGGDGGSSGGDTGGSDQGGSDQGGSQSAYAQSNSSGSGDGSSGSDGSGQNASQNLLNVIYLLSKLNLNISFVDSSSSVLVPEDQVLKGSGLVTGDVVVDGGTVAPGNSPGTQTINNLIFNKGVLEIEIAGLNAGEYDLIHVIKNALDPDATGFAVFDDDNDGIVDSIVRFVFLDYFMPQAGDSITFLTAESGIVGWDKMTIEIGALADGFAYHIVNDGFSLTFVADSDAVFVPEPGTLALLLTGAGGLLVLRRRRRRS